jgi:hypothetical protein
MGNAKPNTGKRNHGGACRYPLKHFTSVEHFYLR